MNSGGRHHSSGSRALAGRLGRSFLNVVWPTQRLLWTREGVMYIAVWIVLLAMGLQQQINLILMVAGLAAGPVVASFLVSARMLKKLSVSRRVPPYVFAGDPLQVDYTLENRRRWTAALALFIEDDATPADRVVSGAESIAPRVFYSRVPGRERSRERWVGISPKRGRYEFRTMEMVTRSPFGLLERRVTTSETDEIIVYPKVGQLSRRWQLMQRQATEARRGQRHDRSSQQQEYHGLRDYRPGDSPRWIHWRTSARVGKPMVKEFEQQNEQDLAVVVDPWVPRSRATAEHRELVERAVEFAATLCLETCRKSGRRLLLGWTGASPGLSQGPASVKLLHEQLAQLAVLPPSSECSFSRLLDVLPPPTLREAVIVVVTTRALNLVEEAERSERLSGTSYRGLLGRIILLDASQGDLDGLIQYSGQSASNVHARREANSSERDNSMGSSRSREITVSPSARNPSRSTPRGENDS